MGGLLFRYIGLRLAAAAAAMIAALAALVGLVDLIESLRFTAKVDGAGFGFALRLTLLRLPGVAESMMPFVFLFAALWAFTQMSTRSELAVIRAAGVSVWRIVLPGLLIAVAAGALVVGALNPFAASLAEASERIKNDVRGRATSFVRVFGDGIWLRERDENSILLINARGFDIAKGELSDVMVLRLAPGGIFRERIDAPSARFAGRTIELKDARMLRAGDHFQQRTPLFAIPTGLTPEDLSEGAPRPETMSVFDLPRYIRLAETAGLPTRRYEMRFHDLASTPFKYAAMVLIAAAFALRGGRRAGGALALTLTAIGTGFVLYVVTRISMAVGDAGVAPAALAAWAPSIAGMIVAVNLLLRLEEG